MFTRVRGVVAGVLLGLVCPVHAHDPGLSAAELRVGDDKLAAHLTFARRDIEVLTSIDADGNGSVSAAEFAAARPHLEKLGRGAIEISVDEQRLSAEPAAIELDGRDALHFRFGFPHTAGARISISVPVIAKLARGHRQYASVRDEQGNLLAERLLDAYRPAFDLALTNVLAADNQAMLPGTAGNRRLITAAQGSCWDTFSDYIREGVWHIWIGYDHILFLLSLLLPAVLRHVAGRWQPVTGFRVAFVEVVKIVTSFTLAHSITLTLAVLGLIALPSRLVESAIAASVLIAALNNLHPVCDARRWVMAFIFGLVHGLGFASVLAELGLPQGSLLLALVGFNVGVELGQLAIVAAFLPVAYVLRQTLFYRRVAFGFGSVLIALLASVWFIERSLDVQLSAGSVLARL